uniref:Uncharacterized protein n=1 Tax=Oryza rufipogon TaxID=4529 RepID=A0A0E0Q2Y6_ORYRU
MVKKKPAGDAEADERRRLRSLAFSNGLLQRGEPGEDEAVGDACVPQEQVSDTADDVFESLIVFSEAWWIGTKEEENPQELKLDFPKEFQNDEAVADSDFKGGAGASCDEAVSINKPPKETTTGSLSPKIESDIDSSEDSDLKDEDNTQSTSQAPSVRQSARTAGKALKYTEISSGDDSSDNDDEIDVPEDMDEKMKSPAVKNESQSEDIKPADWSAQPISAKKEPLVQATLSSIDVQEARKDLQQQKDLLLRSSEQVQRKNIQQGRRVVEDDKIEVLSSSSQDNNVDDDSDEDWAE